MSETPGPTPDASRDERRDTVRERLVDDLVNAAHDALDEAGGTVPYFRPHFAAALSAADVIVPTAAAADTVTISEGEDVDERIDQFARAIYGAYATLNGYECPWDATHESTKAKFRTAADDALDTIEWTSFALTRADGADDE